MIKWIANKYDWDAGALTAEGGVIESQLCVVYIPTNTLNFDGGVYCFPGLLCNLGLGTIKIGADYY